MIKSYEEVEAFLAHFKTKMKIFGIVFIGRAKNRESLEMLGLAEDARLKVVEQIETTDYVETLSDELSFGDMWVFGRDLHNNEMYIKLSQGVPNSHTICVSFHIAEYPLKYAFKDGKNSRHD